MKQRQIPRKLQAARAGAAEKWPYYSQAIYALQPRHSELVGTMAVDRFWRLYWSEAFVEEHTVNELAGVIIHEIEHLLRKHHDRIDNRKGAHWNVAADLEINDDLANSGLTLPVGVLLPSKYELPDGKTAEYYYTDATVQALGDEFESLTGNPFAGHSGSCADGVRKPWEEGDPTSRKDGILPDEADSIREGVARDVIEHEKSIGTVPGHLKRWADEIVHPKVDWRTQLRALVRRAIAQVSGMSDYSYSRPSRRQSVLGKVVMPSLVDRQPNVAIVVDTSGSMSSRELEQALAEVRGVVDALGRKQAVRVLSCDAQVHTCQRIFDASQVELAGGGGTDMGVGLQEAELLRPKPDIIVVFTDGGTPWPSGPPKGSKVVVCLTTEGTPTPEWAHTVHVPVEGANDIGRGVNFPGFFPSSVSPIDPTT